MIIVCPECTGPFELADEHIAELVQLECPSCAFRMILDFAAANDRALVENGMRMASGFRSRADYAASIAPPIERPTLTPVAEPEPEPAPEPAIRPEPRPEPAPIEQPRVAAEARPARPAARVEPTPAAEPRAARPAQPEEVRRPVRPSEPARPAEPARPTPAARPTFEPPRPTFEPPRPAEPTLFAPPEAAQGPRPTFEPPSSTPTERPQPSMPTQPSMQTQPTQPTQPTMPAMPSMASEPRPAEAARGFAVEAPDLDEEAETHILRPEDHPTMPETVGRPSTAPSQMSPQALADAAARDGARIPPHSPPARRAASLGAESGPAPAHDMVLDSSSTDLAKPSETKPATRSSTGAAIGKWLLVALILIVAGLVGASFAKYGTPDPRPLLQELLE